MKIKKKSILIIIFIIVFLALAGGFFLFGFGELNFGSFTPAKTFELDILFLRATIEEGGEITSNVGITNSDESQHFSVSINKISDLVNVIEDEFDLAPGQEYELEVVLKSKEAGVYLGSLDINANTVVRVPIILEIQTKDLFFDTTINLLSKEKRIFPGQKLETELSIFDLADVGKRNIKLIYFIKDFEEKAIISESENLFVSKKLDYSKSFDLPDNLNPGEYALIVLTQYNNSVGVSSEYFKVEGVGEEISAGGEGKITGTRTSESNLLFIVIIMFGFFFMIFLIIFVYSVFYRDKLLTELQNQYKSELKRQRELIEGKEKTDYVKLRTSAEKKEYKREIEEIKKQRIKILREMQEKRVGEFRKIKKKFKGDQLKKQLETWKKQGYDTSILEKKYKLPNVKSIRKKINKWKRQGYNTGILKKKLK